MHKNLKFSVTNLFWKRLMGVSLFTSKL